jgi:hypothetical protein
LTAGLDKNGYYHELFLRDRLDLAARIPRCKVKGTGVRAKSNPEDEPNFWSMTWVPRGEQQEGAVAPSSSSSSSPSKKKKKKKKRTFKRSASVVSDHASEDEHKMDVDPPVTVSSGSDPDDVVLFGWGKPFHLLDDVPSSADEEDNSRNASAAVVMKPVPVVSSPNIEATMSTIPIKKELPDKYAAKVPEIEDEEEGPRQHHDEIDFDKLVDELFSHDQSLQFSELLRLAAS